MTKIPKQDLKALILENTPLIRSVCFKIIRDPEKAADAVQNSILLVVENAEKYRGEGSFSSWMCTIAFREALRFSKQEKTIPYDILMEHYHRGEIDLAAAPDFNEEIWTRNVCNACLTGVAATLVPEERLALLLRYLGDFSYRDIAGVLDKTEEACRQYVHRARKKFMHFINEECAYFEPGALCRCGMADPVKRISLADEFFHLRKTTTRINFFKEWNSLLPKKNWWLEK